MVMKINRMLFCPLIKETCKLDHCAIFSKDDRVCGFLSISDCMDSMNGKLSDIESTLRSIEKSIDNIS